MKLVVQGDGEPYEPIMAVKKYFYRVILPLTNYEHMLIIRLEGVSNGKAEKL
jgi:hypothetical protein